LERSPERRAPRAARPNAAHPNRSVRPPTPTAPTPEFLNAPRAAASRTGPTVTALDKPDTPYWTTVTRTRPSG